MPAELLAEELQNLPRSEVEAMLSGMEAEMAEASASMDYEHAAELRDQSWRKRIFR